MLAQSHLGFAESPVFIAHQAEYGQQLRLGELVFAETTPVGRQNHRGYIHSHASKRQESDFWHRTSCPIRKHHHRSLVLMQISLCAKDVNRATWGGKSFGYREGDNLWTHHGRHVGRFDGDEIYGPDGAYLGELRNKNRLITNIGKKGRRMSGFG